MTVPATQRTASSNAAEELMTHMHASRTEQETREVANGVEIVRRTIVVRGNIGDTLESHTENKDPVEKNSSDEGITCLELLTGIVAFCLEPFFYIGEKVLSLFSSKKTLNETSGEDTDRVRLENRKESPAPVNAQSAQNLVEQGSIQQVDNPLGLPELADDDQQSVSSRTSEEDNMEGDSVTLVYLQDPALQAFAKENEEDLSSLLLSKWKEIDSIGLDSSKQFLAKALIGAVWSQCEKQVTDEEGIVDDYLADKIFAQRMGQKIVLKNGELCASLKHSFEAYEEAIAVEDTDPKERFQDIVDTTTRGNFRGYKTYPLFA